MRVLVLIRGVPGSGKSHFVKTNNLEPYSINVDSIRNLYFGPTMKQDGSITADLSKDRLVWVEVMKIVEHRMQNGELVVVDATHVKKNAVARYHTLCGKYRYRCFIVDLTHVSMETCKQNNLLREPWKRVPNAIIERYHYNANDKQETPPNWAKTVKPENFQSIFQWRCVDISNYEKIHYFGDIEGCYSPLKEFFDKNEMNDKHFYIFVGNLLDRGLENLDTLKFFLKIYENPNVCILEGTKDTLLWKWATDTPFANKEFRKKTLYDITRECKNDEEIEELKKSVRNMFRKFQQLSYHKFHDKEILVTPGGLSKIPENLTVLSQTEIMNGSGDIDDPIDDWFLSNFSDNQNLNQFQIHGNRNPQLLPCITNPRSFNLHCGVQYGGYLRIVSLDSTNGFAVTEIKNQKSRWGTVEGPESHDKFLNNIFVAQLKENKGLVKEKKLADNVSSFNFTEKAFIRRMWNAQTIKARGLFIDGKFEVVARSYDKFFNLDEVPMTEYENLQHNFQFPVISYVKENGYLGILSGVKDEVTGTYKLFAASKSTNEGPYASEFKKLIVKHLTEKGMTEEFLAADLFKRKVSCVFEVIIPDFDPHIIQYSNATLVLLDIIENILTRFVRYHTPEREEFAAFYGFKTKTLYKVINDWGEWEKWYEEIGNPDFKVNGNPVEGFVIEDAKQFMLKIKLSYYQMWKNARKFKDKIARGGKVNMKEVDRGVRDFVAWLRTLEKKELKQDIITLRSKWKMLNQKDEEEEEEIEQENKEENKEEN